MGGRAGVAAQVARVTTGPAGPKAKERGEDRGPPKLKSKPIPNSSTQARWPRQPQLFQQESVVQSCGTVPSKDRRRPPSAMVLGPSRGRFCSGEQRLLCVCMNTRPQTKPVELGVSTKRCRTLQRQACQQTFKCLKWPDGLDGPRHQARGKEHRQEGVGHLWDRLVRQTDGQTDRQTDRPTKGQDGNRKNYSCQAHQNAKRMQQK